jgi:hypothetical protein
MVASSRIPAPSPVANTLRSVSGAWESAKKEKARGQRGAGDEPAGASEPFDDRG